MISMKRMWHILHGAEVRARLTLAGAKTTTLVGQYVVAKTPEAAITKATARLMRKYGIFVAPGQLTVWAIPSPTEQP